MALLRIGVRQFIAFTFLYFSSFIVEVGMSKCQPTPSEKNGNIHYPKILNLVFYLALYQKTNSFQNSQLTRGYN